MRIGPGTFLESHKILHPRRCGNPVNPLICICLPTAVLPDLASKKHLQSTVLQRPVFMAEMIGFPGLTPANINVAFWKIIIDLMSHHTIKATSNLYQILPHAFWQTQS